MLRRSVTIVAGACAALVLAGTAGAVAWQRSSGDGTGRPVGTWHEAPGGGLTEDGGQRVGEVLVVDKLLGYGAPSREVLRYPGASYVKLRFGRLAMLPGDYVTVSDPTGQESYRYEAPAEPGDRWAMSVTGDAAVVEVHRGAGNVVGKLLDGLGVRVDRVARGLSPGELTRVPDEQPLAPSRTGREESVCGGDESSDAVCYKSADPVAYTRSRAIARLLINGTELCTGWRIGSKNRMLTNNHCFERLDDATQAEVWFEYACAACGGRDPVKPTKVWAAKVLATDHVYDYSLFTVAEFGKVKKFGTLTLDTTRPGRGQELYVPQHPAGQPTRIAGRLGERAGTCAVASNSFDGYAKSSDVSYFCDTAGGSSGSPVLSRKTDKVVALHHFGGCPNSGVRADLLYRRIKQYL